MFTQEIDVCECEVDYSTLLDKENGAEEVGLEFTTAISNLKEKISALAPSLAGADQLDDVHAKLENCAVEFDAARKHAKEAKERFNRIKQDRFLFILPKI